MQKHNSSKKSTNNISSNSNTLSTHNIFLLLPIVFILAVVPLIVHLREYTTDFTQYPWFDLNGEKLDFFLYYKQVFFNFISVVMCIIIAVSAYKREIKIRFSPIYVPLAIYAILYFLSSILTKYRSYSLTGSFEQFESIFTILGYCLAVYYIFLFVQSEQDFHFIIKGLLISSFVISFIAITQLIGHDFFNSGIGVRLITPLKKWSTIKSYTMVFGKHYAYSTLYNPNYIGVYAALVAPLLLFMSFFTKNIKWRILYLIGFIGLIISTIGARSEAGLISLAAALIFSLIFFWRYIVKYKKFIIPFLCLGILSLVIINVAKDNILVNKLQSIIKLEKVTPNLTDIQTKDDCLIITYSGNSLTLQSSIDDNKNMYFVLLDDNGQPIQSQLNNDGTLTLLDERFPGFIITPSLLTDTYGYGVKIDNVDWYFSNFTGDGTYYYCNAYGRFDKIKTAPSAVFTGYEYLFTDRGYMWSRTIPMIKDYVLFGIGANNYTIAFPQKDYVNQYNFDHELQIVTRPHNIYLQIAIQGGLISLIAFLIFYLWYFVTSIKLFMKGSFQNIYTQIGFGIFIGTIGYMICTLTNDSMIPTAVVYWTLMGLGIVANQKAKQVAKA
jgi:hypothetical protein